MAGQNTWKVKNSMGEFSTISAEGFVVREGHLIFTKGTAGIGNGVENVAAFAPGQWVSVEQ